MKNQKALYTLMLANAISSFAQGITLLAIPWYFAHTLDQPGLFGFYFSLSTAISVVWSLYGGTLVDRYSRKGIFLLLNVAGFAMLGATALVGFFNGALSSLWVGLVFMFTTFNFQLHYPALYAFGQEISEPKHYGKINSLLEVQGQVTKMLSASIGALLLGGYSSDTIPWLSAFLGDLEISQWPIHQIFALDAFTYMAAFLIILLIRYQPVHREAVDKSPILDRLKVGFQFMKENPSVFVLGFFSHNFFAMTLIEMHFLMALYVNDHLMMAAYIFGVSKLFYAVGAVASGIWMRRIFGAGRYVKGILFLMAIGAIFFIGASMSDYAPIFFAFNFVLGLSNAGIRILRVTWLFHRVPNRTIGRAGSVFQVMNILVRLVFISLFSMAFFTSGNQVIYAYAIAGAFVIMSMIPIVLNYKAIKIDGKTNMG